MEKQMENEMESGIISGSQYTNNAYIGLFGSLGLADSVIPEFSGWELGNWGSKYAFRCQRRQLHVEDLIRCHACRLWLPYFVKSEKRRMEHEQRIQKKTSKST